MHLPRTQSRKEDMAAALIGAGPTINNTYGQSVNFIQGIKEKAVEEAKAYEEPEAQVVAEVGEDRDEEGMLAATGIKQRERQMITNQNKGKVMQIKLRAQERQTLEENHHQHPKLELRSRPIRAKINLHRRCSLSTRS